MTETKFFPQPTTVYRTIYGYEVLGETHKGLIKVGETMREVNKRVKEQTKTAGVKTKIVFEEIATKQNGEGFRDKDVHKVLKKYGIANPEGEWFKCTVEDLQRAVHEIKTGEKSEEKRTGSFGMRPEQAAAVKKTAAYFKRSKRENPNETPHFLWNAKMRFGKTFASYQLAKAMGWRKLLVLTFKPAVQDAWQQDLMTHKDFEGWQFVTEGNERTEIDKGLVYFGSFQNHLGTNKAGKTKDKNKWVHETDWDCVIFDEYHYGAWRDNARDLFGNDLEADKEAAYYEQLDKEGYIDEQPLDLFEANLPIRCAHYLYLSGTPFRALSGGEFIEEQIFNWTYSDEQKAKAAWQGDKNPYAALPRMVLLTYKLPEKLEEIAREGEFDTFDLNLFFAAKGKGKAAKFLHKNAVQGWLNLIRGSFEETWKQDLQMGDEKPPLPFSHVPLLNVLNHTFWFLPTVASCNAMANLISEPQNTFYHDYTVVVAAGTEAGVGVEALKPVEKAMTDNPFATKTITLSCGKLTTGVSVKPWTGIFMLRNSSSPETYFQAAFRVQTPWVIKNPDGKSPNKEEIIKEECYVFDFAPDRALKQVAEYACRLNVQESNAEKSVEEFINFLPVLAYDGSAMLQVDAASILDIAMSGTSATLLARRWQSALLVNVDNETLKKLLNNEEALAALSNIEGFRNINQDIKTIINTSDGLKKPKKGKGAEEGEPKEPKGKPTAEEKEMKQKRKEIQEKLIKFATRIPVFMYLTDYRERSLTEVITQLEPELFKKVTGLEIKDFDLLVSLGVFNRALMNDAIRKFKSYEDASLEYIGINKHKDEAVGLFDTVEQRKVRFVNEPA